MIARGYGNVAFGVNGAVINLPPSAMQALNASLDEILRKADQDALACAFWTEMCDRYAAHHTPASAEPQEGDHAR